jgi:hypothetical protein
VVVDGEGPAVSQHTEPIHRTELVIYSAPDRSVIRKFLEPTASYTYALPEDGKILRFLILVGIGPNRDQAIPFEPII